MTETKETGGIRIDVLIEGGWMEGIDEPPLILRLLVAGAEDTEEAGKRLDGTIRDWAKTTDGEAALIVQNADVPCYGNLREIPDRFLLERGILVTDRIVPGFCMPGRAKVPKSESKEEKP